MCPGEHQRELTGPQPIGRFAAQPISQHNGVIAFCRRGPVNLLLKQPAQLRGRPVQAIMVQGDIHDLR